MSPLFTLSSISFLRAVETLVRGDPAYNLDRGYCAKNRVDATGFQTPLSVFHLNQFESRLFHSPYRRGSDNPIVGTALGNMRRDP